VQHDGPPGGRRLKQKQQVILKHETYEKEKVPRPINDTGRQQTYMAGKFVKRLEEDMRGLPWVLKGLKPRQRARKMRATVQRRELARGPQVVISFDGAGWDGSLSDELLEATERLVFEKYGEPSDLVREWLALLRSERRYATRNRVLTVSYLGTRRSGDAHTKAGNDLINFIIQTFAMGVGPGLDYYAGDYDLFVDGDDCILILDYNDLIHKRIEMYAAVIASTGVEPEIALGRPYADRSTPEVAHLKPAEFCSAYLCHGDGLWGATLLPVYPKTLLRFPWSIRTSEMDLIGLARAKALSTLAMTPTAPIVREMALATAHHLRQGRIPARALIDDQRLERMGCDTLDEAYGLLMDAQVAAELIMGDDEDVRAVEQRVLRRTTNRSHDEYVAMIPQASRTTKREVASMLGVRTSTLMAAEQEALRIWRDAATGAHLHMAMTSTKSIYASSISTMHKYVVNANMIM
jgi:hypothetical protein